MSLITAAVAARALHVAEASGEMPIDVFRNAADTVANLFGMGRFFMGARKSAAVRPEVFEAPCPAGRLCDRTVLGKPRFLSSGIKAEEVGKRGDVLRGQEVTRQKFVIKIPRERCCPHSGHADGAEHFFPDVSGASGNDVSGRDEHVGPECWSVLAVEKEDDLVPRP